MAELRHESDQMTVQDIINLYEKDKLMLSPGFQRDSVWTIRDRQKLVDSILRNYPIPSIFLYRRVEDGEILYDVIDGKQRLESILMFVGLIRGNRFQAKVHLPDTNEREWIDWQSLQKQKKQALVTGYKLRTIEVEGDLADIIDLFVRINSTGKALTAAEKRHARFYRSQFLKTAGKLANSFAQYFRKGKILSAGQISRMKHVELICELMLSIHQGDVINKKAALDRVMKAESLTDRDVKRAKEKTARAIHRVKRMFPQLYRTRFHQVSDYYSLVMLIAQFEQDGLILTDRCRNQLAWDLLVAFSNGVDQVRVLQKQAKGTKPEQETYREYLMSVLQATDEISQRRKRQEILRGLLESLFERKDENRTFSVEQRRLLWNTSAARKCSICGKPMTWEDFSIDHISPYSKGGRTKIENAALAHRSCNSKKGNR